MKRPTIFMGGRIHIVKMAVLLKAIYRFNVTPIKIPMTIFTKQKDQFQVHWRYRMILNDQVTDQESLPLRTKHMRFTSYYMINPKPRLWRQV
jgi:hypothetical protein